jgi:hypothetical protein
LDASSNLGRFLQFGTTIAIFAGAAKRYPGAGERDLGDVTRPVKLLVADNV